MFQLNYNLYDSQFTANHSFMDIFEVFSLDFEQFSIVAYNLQKSYLLERLTAIASELWYNIFAGSLGPVTLS